MTAGKTYDEALRADIPVNMFALAWDCPNMIYDTKPGENTSHNCPRYFQQRIGRTITCQYVITEKL